MLWELLTFERMLTGPVLHLIYWAGLGIVALFGFSALGAGVGLAIKSITAKDLSGILIALPVLVGGLLAVVAMALIWRAICEFYVAVFRIADDLHALRQADEAQRSGPRTS
jgi:hypothetical protein